MLQPYTVTWKQVAEDALTQAWLDHQDHQDLLASLVDEIDAQLRSRPDLLGEQRDDKTRIYMEGTRRFGCVIIYFEVNAANKSVEVLQFRFRFDGFSTS
jgi:hypothetical protein